MKQLLLFSGGPATTVLGFGTTSMMGLTTNRERQLLLEHAFEAGIRHFDTAPSYGYGEAERVLGDFARTRRDQLTITTKFGLQPPAVVNARWINLLARRILSLAPCWREFFSGKAKKLSKKAAFNATEARLSLDRSLSALKTDYVDLFLLHEPAFSEAASEELREFLENEVRGGRIRAFGCGGDFGVIQRVASAQLPTSRWLQFEDNALRRRIEIIKRAGTQCITYGPFRETLVTLARWLGSDSRRCSDWERQLGCDCHAETNLAALLQAASHARNPDGIVLFSTRQSDRIASAVQTASGKRFSPEQVDKFEELTSTLQLVA